MSKIIYVCKSDKRYKVMVSDQSKICTHCCSTIKPNEFICSVYSEYAYYCMECCKHVEHRPMREASEFWIRLRRQERLKEIKHACV